MAIIMTLWVGNGAVLKSSSKWQLNENQIIPALNYILPIHKVIIMPYFKMV